MPARTAAGRTKRLAAIPLFAGLPKAAVERIGSATADFEAKAGEVLIQPSAPGSGLFVIEEGTVEVELRRQRIKLGPGEFVGEIALLDPRAVRTARVRASSDVRGFVVNRTSFLRLIEAEPKIAVAMLKVLAQRLADAVTL